MTTIKTAAVAATLALASAVPATATVLNFEFFSDSEGGPLLWGAKIDFGDFGFDEFRPNFNGGITLTRPAAPFNTGTASYSYNPENSTLFFIAQGAVVGDQIEQFFYFFSAECVPVCANGDDPFISGADVLAPDSLRDALIGATFAGLTATAVTDVTPPPAEPPSAVIPLPAAGWLLLGGLGALGLMRRRRT